MPEELLQEPKLILVIAVVIIVSMLIKSLLGRIRAPAVLGYLAMGLAVRLTGDRWDLLPDGSERSLELLADLGIICLLFRVGIESDFPGMVRELPRAVTVWLANVLGAALLVFVTARFVLHLDIGPSLFVAAALSATSIGIAAACWEDAGALRSRLGELMLDVAELDDISAVLSMVLLFTAVPFLLGTRSTAEFGPALAAAAGWMLVKAIVFGAACFTFARYIERPVTHWFTKVQSPPAPMLVVVGIGFVISALAGWLGFSVAVGALFAGLLFSRDPEAVKLEASFQPIYELFTPFFFLGIGYRLEPGTLISAAAMGSILLAPAVVGKLVGAGVPVFCSFGAPGAMLLGVSMIPRAEIALFIVDQGNKLGERLVPDSVYGAVVFVSAVTCFGAPIPLRSLLSRWPQQEETTPGSSA